MTRNIGLKGKLFFLLLIITLFSSATFTTFLYRALHNGIIEGIDGRLESVAYGVHEMIPPSYYQRITGPDSIPTAEYMALMTRLTNFANQTGMVYAYSYMMFGKDIVTTATSATAKEWRAKTYDRFFKHYASAPPRLYETFADHKMRFDEYTDSYGRFRSIYLPETAPDGRTYVIGADFPLSFLDSRLHHALMVSILIGAVLFILSIGAGLGAISRIVRPLHDLRELAENTEANNFAIAADDLDRMRAIGQARGDEIGSLADAMEKMLSTLLQYLVDLKAATAARERMEAEFSAAHDIQRGMLPRELPRLPAWSRVSLEASMEPAKAVGGDLYDFFLLNDGRLFLLVGDVSGKGLPAALFMAVTKTKFRTHMLAGGATGLGAVLQRVNRELVDENPAELFVTIFAAVLDLATGEVEYCDGGHDAPLLLRADGRSEWLKKKGGLALGLMDDYPYAEDRFLLAPGDGMVLFTDGVTEATNRQQALFGAERIQKTLGGLAAGVPADEISARLLAAVKAFCDGAEQSDDITLLALRYTGVEAPAAALAPATTA